MRVHSVLPDALTAAVDAALAGVEHVPHRGVPDLRAAELAAGGARDRGALLSAMRSTGPFDEHGDPVDPPVWLYRAAMDWSLRPDRPL